MTAEKTFKPNPKAVANHPHHLRRGVTIKELATIKNADPKTVAKYTSMPRADYLATHTVNRDKPWEDEGISRRTWYRRKKAQQESS